MTPVSKQHHRRCRNYKKGLSLSISGIISKMTQESALHAVNFDFCNWALIFV